MIMLPRRFYFDNALDDLFEEEGAKMKCDIYEKENTYHVDMDLPGFKKDEIKVECNKGNLIVSAEKKPASNEKITHTYITFISMSYFILFITFIIFSFYFRIYASTIILSI